MLLFTTVNGLTETETEKFAKTETKLKRKKTVKNETETETEKFFTTEITLGEGRVNRRR